ncbi:MAG TPA: TolC family protein [Gemmatimonadaceae bacterium]|nr:TolC family protein [Gemmatimonadaceae bacterium]
MQKRLILVLTALAPCSIAVAQSPSAPSIIRPNSNPAAVATLSLDEAIQLAKRNNPLHLSTLNNRSSADAAVRSAYGALLPNADASFTALRQQGGRQIFNGGSFGASSDVNQSQYNIGIGYRLNSASLVTPRLQRASRNAVEADITGSAEVLRAQVTQQYLTTLQAEDRAKLQDTLLVAAKSQVVLAQARALVGSGTQLDVSRAEVAFSQQQVQLLQARNQIDIEKLKLFQLLGIDQPADVVLTTQFKVEPQPLSLPELLASAKEKNPVILALRSRERVADLNVRRAKGEYSPTLSINTGISGYTYAFTNSNFPVQQALAEATASQAACIRTEEVRAALNLSNKLAACSAIGLSDAQIADLRHQNSQFPFRFQNAPKSISATLSLPLFDGFAREERVQEAQVNSADARYNVRARELAIVADVTAAYLTLKTAEKTSALQEQNSAKAKIELKFTQDRYRNGQANFVDLVESRAAYERAESDRINAIYDYHKAFAALESAVGRPLR